MSADHDKPGQKRRRWWTMLLMFPFFQVGPILPGAEGDDQLDRLRRLKNGQALESGTSNPTGSEITPESTSTVLPATEHIEGGSGTNVGTADEPTHLDANSTST